MAINHPLQVRHPTQAMKPTAYILAIGQHPSITDVRLVEKSKWPVKPCQDNCEEHPQYCFDTCVKSYEYDSDKLEALQQGAVVEYDMMNENDSTWVALRKLGCVNWFTGTGNFKSGVYELDHKWVVEIKEQFLRRENQWIDCPAYFNPDSGFETRRIAILKPAQPMKESEPIQKADSQTPIKEGWEESWEKANTFIKSGVNPHAYRLGWLDCQEQFKQLTFYLETEPTVATTSTQPIVLICENCKRYWQAPKSQCICGCTILSVTHPSNINKVECPPWQNLNPLN